MKNNKKGFTIVELVIVIAVIAILAAVLIPTFTSVTNKAKGSAAQQTAKTAQTAVLSSTNGVMTANTLFAVDGNNDGAADYVYIVENEKLVEKDVASVKAENTNYPASATNASTGVKEYTVFVTANYFNSEKRTADITKKAEGLVKDMLTKQLGTGTLTTINVIPAGEDFATWTYAYTDGEDPKNANIFVYYNGDIPADCVVFFANN